MNHEATAPKITILPPYDDTETGTQTTVKALDKGSGKNGRPLVADLIRLRENESKLVQELTIEKAQEQALQAAQRLKRLNLRNDLNEWIP